MSDNVEVGEMNPNVRSVIAYNTDSKIIPTVRSNGVLLEQVVPQGGTISGQSSIMQLDGWNWEDATYKADDGIHVNWPRMYVVKAPRAEPEDVQRQKIQKNINDLDLFFREAKAYCSSTPQEKNLKFEAMRGLFDGTKKLYVHCDYVKEIASAIDMAKRMSLKLVIVGGSDSYLVTDLLKANNVAVILGRTHSLPSREDDDVALPYKLPSILQKAGVLYAVSIESSWQSRNLGFMAGTGAGFGLTQEEAVVSITSNAATILGIDQTVGTLEVGKDATFFMSAGDALDMRTQNVEAAYIGGREINLDNVQKQLYNKYQTKYGIK
jgi:imidazolonepropionase-like amidohydrolase